MILPIGARGIITPGLGFIHPYPATGPFGGHATLGEKIAAYYKFNDSSGSTAVDSTGNYNATISGNVTLGEDGPINKAFYFDGTNSLVTVPDGVRQTGKYGITLWAKAYNWDNNTHPALYGGNHLSDNSYKGGIAISIYNSRYIYCDQYSSTTRHSIAYDFNGVMSTGTWYFYSLIYNNDHMYLYINASLVVSGQKGAMTIDWTGKSGNIGHMIGASYQGSKGIKRWKGHITEFGIWSDSLTSTEVTALYNSGNGLTY